MTRRDLPPAKSIDAWGGLKPFLDGTAEQHNGLKYKDFLSRIRPRKHPISKATAAEDFGVSRETWYRWLRKHAAEQETTVPDSEDSRD